jgi:hypothetical protein
MACASPALAQCAMRSRKAWNAGSQAGACAGTGGRRASSCASRSCAAATRLAASCRSRTAIQRSASSNASRKAWKPAASAAWSIVFSRAR